jgi:hypothetical protein
VQKCKHVWTDSLIFHVQGCRTSRPRADAQQPAKEPDQAQHAQPKHHTLRRVKRQRMPHMFHERNRYAFVRPWAQPRVISVSRPAVD